MNDVRLSSYLLLSTNLLITLSMNLRPSISWEMRNVCHLLTVRKSSAVTLRELEKQTIVSTGALSSSRFRRSKNTAGVRSPGFVLSSLPIVIRNKLTTLKFKNTYMRSYRHHEMLIQPKPVSQVLFFHFDVKADLPLLSAEWKIDQFVSLQTIQGIRYQNFETNL